MLDPKLSICLPSGVVVALTKSPPAEEIRLRSGCPVTITVNNKCLILNYTVSQKEIDECVASFCKNSLHTYFDNIINGYIPFEEGYRVGVSGRAVTDNGRVINVSPYLSLNIRIPTNVPMISQDILNKPNYNGSILVYSPANSGKTTLLKLISRHISLPPYNKKVVVIDSKQEIYSNSLHKGASIDFYIGYPKYQAIDMAVRNMSPDVIICDEIGLGDDTTPLIDCANCGVSLICSAHAATFDELKNRDNIRTLLDKGIFKTLIGIQNTDGKREYTVTSVGGSKC